MMMHRGEKEAWDSGESKQRPQRRLLEAATHTPTYTWLLFLRQEYHGHKVTVNAIIFSISQRLKLRHKKV